MSEGLSLPLELTFFWPNRCFWVSLRGMPHPRLLGASPAVVRLTEAGPETPWSPVPSRSIWHLPALGGGSALERPSGIKGTDLPVGKEMRQEGSLERDSTIWLLDSQHKHTLKRKVFSC